MKRYVPDTIEQSNIPLSERWKQEDLATARTANLANENFGTRALKRGLLNTKAMLGGATALAGEATGIQGLSDYGMDVATSASEAASTHPGVEFEDITGPVSGAQWVAEKAIENLPFMVGTGGAAAGVRALAGKGLSKYVGEKAVQKIAARGLADKAGTQLAGTALTDAARLQAGRNAGATFGVIGGTGVMEAGGNFQELMESTGGEVSPLAPYTSLGLGVIAGVLETMGGSQRVIDKVLGADTGSVFRKALGRVEGSVNLGKIPAPTDYGILKRITAEALRTGGEEAATEVLQEVLSLANMGVNDPTFEVMTKENAMRLVESGAAGAAVGGVLGGPSGAISGRQSYLADRFKNMNDKTLAQSIQNYKEKYVSTNDETEKTQYANIGKLAVAELDARNRLKAMEASGAPGTAEEPLPTEEPPMEPTVAPAPVESPIVELPLVDTAELPPSTPTFKPMEPLPAGKIPKAMIPKPVTRATIIKKMKLDNIKHRDLIAKLDKDGETLDVINTAVQDAEAERLTKEEEKKAKSVAKSGKKPPEEPPPVTPAPKPTPTPEPPTASILDTMPKSDTGIQNAVPSEETIKDEIVQPEARSEAVGGEAVVPTGVVEPSAVEPAAVVNDSLTTAPVVSQKPATSEAQKPLSLTGETQTGAEKLPPIGYVTAQKQPTGKYKLFYTGTRNEVFPNETFVSAGEARNYYKVQKIKRETVAEAKPPVSEPSITPDRLAKADLTTAITDLTDADTGETIPAGTEHYALTDGTNLAVDSYEAAKSGKPLSKTIVASTAPAEPVSKTVASTEKPANKPTLEEYMAGDIKEKRRSSAMADLQKVVDRLGRDKIEQVAQLQSGESIRAWIEREARQTAEWVSTKKGGTRNHKTGQTAIEKYSKPWNIFRDSEGETQFRKAALAYIRGEKNGWLEKGEGFDSSEVRTPLKYEQLYQPTTPKPPAVPESVVITGTAKNKTVETPMPKKAESLVTQKEQKAYLLAEIDKAIAALPDEDAVVDKDAAKTLTFMVPNDGEFTIDNMAHSLNQFRERVTKQFPDTEETRWKPIKIKKPNIPRGESSPRAEGEGIFYYRPYKRRNQGIIVSTSKYGNDNNYVDGIFSNGSYAVKTDKSPIVGKVKSTSRREVKSGMFDSYIEQASTAIPANIVAETSHGTNENTAALVHVIDDNNRHFALRADYVDVILNLFPNAKPFTSAKSNLTLFKDDNGDVVGFVAPWIEGKTIPGTIESLPSTMREGYEAKQKGVKTEFSELVKEQKMVEEQRLREEKQREIDEQHRIEHEEAVRVATEKEEQERIDLEAKFLELKNKWNGGVYENGAKVKMGVYDWATIVGKRGNQILVTFDDGSYSGDKVAIDYEEIKAYEDLKSNESIHRVLSSKAKALGLPALPVAKENPTLDDYNEYVAFKQEVQKSLDALAETKAPIQKKLDKLEDRVYGGKKVQSKTRQEYRDLRDQVYKLDKRIEAISNVSSQYATMQDMVHSDYIHYGRVGTELPPERKQAYRDNEGRDTTTTRFATRPGSVSTTAIPESEVRSTIDALASKFKVEYEVVSKVTDLPLVAVNEQGKVDNLRAIAMKQRDSGDAPLGIYHGSKVYIVAENIQSKEEAARVFIHEAVGHYGLRKVMGRDFEDFLRRLLSDSRYVNEIRKYGEKYGFKDRLVAADEWFAWKAESVDEKSTLWQDFVAAVKRWLARAGMDFQFGRTELVDLLQQTKQAAIKGGKVDVTAERASFSTRPTGYTDTPAFKRWFGPWQEWSLADRLADPNGLAKLIYDLGTSQTMPNSALQPMQLLMIRMAQNDKIARHIISFIPIDVMNRIMGKKVSTNELSRDPSMFVNALDAPIPNNDLATLAVPMTRIATELRSSLAAGTDKIGLSALKTSDFSLGEVAGLLAFHRLADFGAGNIHIKPISTSEGTKSTATLPNTPVGDFESDSAEFARLLYHHTLLSQGLNAKDKIPPLSSQVKNENGEPLVVYHGTDKTFNKFSFKNAGQKIIWFTSNKSEIEAGNVGAAGHGKVMELYASLKNPAGWKEYEKLGLWELKSRGYDGAILDNGDGTFDGFVFDSNQLKSATKNTGAFDPTNPDIRFTTRSRAESVANDTPEEGWKFDLADSANQLRSAFQSRNQNWNKNNDVNFLDTTFSLLSHYADKIPALRRAWEAATRLSDNKHIFENRIFRTDNPNDPDNPTKHLEIINDYDKNNKAESKKIQKYLLENDQNNYGYTVGRNEVSNRYELYSPDAIEISYHNTPVEAQKEKAKLQKQDPSAKYFYVQEDGGVRLYAKKIVGTFKSDKEAWAEAVNREVNESGFSADGKAALRSYKAIAHQMFDFQMKDINSVISQYEEQGLPLPTRDVWLDGRKVNVDLKQAMLRMGDLRGWYMPRNWEQGEYYLLAKKPGHQTILKFYDWAGKDPFTAAGSPINLMEAKLVKQGYTIVKDRASKLSEDVYAQVGTKMAIKDLLTYSLSKAGDEITQASLGIDNFKSTLVGSTLTITGKEFDSTQEQILEQNGGTLVDGEWKFEDATDNTESKIIKDLLEYKNITYDPMLSLAEIVTDAVVNTIRERGALSHRIKRQEATGANMTVGYEENPFIAITQAGKGIAGAAAKNQMAKEMYDAKSGRDVAGTWADYKKKHGKDASFDEYKSLVKNNALNPDTERNANNVFNELFKDMLRNEDRSERIIETIRGLATLKFLAFRVASPLVNLTALPTSATASISGYTGAPIVHTMNMLGRMATAYGKHMMHRDNSLTPEEKSLFREIEDKGWHIAQFNREAITTLQSKVGRKYSGFIDWGMKIFGWTEQINRAATIATAYMSIKNQSQNKVWNQADHDAALLQAKHISDKAHGVYGKVNLPMMFRGSNFGAQAGRMFYVFKTFAHTYWLTMVDLLNKGGVFNAQGWKDRNATAKRAALWMATAPAILGGTGASIMASAVFGALGMGNPDDPEEEFYKWVDNTFGQTGNIFARTGLAGLPSAVGGPGINIKGSLKLNTALPTTIMELFGAPASALEEVGTGAKDILKGDVRRGIETILPTGFGNISKAEREYSRGLESKGHTPMFYGTERTKLTGLEALGKGLLSVTPARTAMMKEEQYKETQVAKSYGEIKSGILARLREYYSMPENKRRQKDLEKINADIDRFNERVANKPIAPITRSTIRSELTRATKPGRKERRREATTLNNYGR